MISFAKLRTAIMSVKELPETFPFGVRMSEVRSGAIGRAPHLQTFAGELMEMAEACIGLPHIPIPYSAFRIFEKEGTRKEYEGLYFERRRRMCVLALAAWLDRTGKYTDALHDILWDICNEYTWALPAHLPPGLEDCLNARHPPELTVDLFAAETAHALSEIYVLLEPCLDDWIRYRIRSEIERRVFRPVFDTSVHFNWEAARMNWSSVCGGAVGMAALILEKDPERLAGMIDRVVRTLECYLEGAEEDGGIAEGINYWTYGFGYFTYFSEMLCEFTSGQIDLLQGAKQVRIAEFPNKISFSQGCFTNYSDAAQRHTLQPGMISRLIHKLRIEAPSASSCPNMHSDRLYRWGHITRNMLWTDPKMLDRETREGSYYLEQLQWTVTRHYSDNRTMIAFSAKGGHNAEPHNHNDLGHFILHIGGESLLADLGAGVYDKRYFGPNRYESVYASSAGHSVPVIEGFTQGAGRGYAAKVLGWSHHGMQTDFHLDLTRAYDWDGLTGFTRRFVWTGGDGMESAILELQDRFRFREIPSRLEEVFISLHKPVLEAGRIEWKGKHGSVVMYYEQDDFYAESEAVFADAGSPDGACFYRIKLNAARFAPEMEPCFRFLCKTE